MDHYSVLNIFSFFLLPKLNWFTFWSETLGTLTDWTGANYSTIICNLAGRHLGLLSCRRRGINTSLLFRRKVFSRPVMYYSNSNAIFQPELLIICAMLMKIQGLLVNETKQGQLLQHVPFVRKLLLKIKDALSVGCVMIWRMSSVQILRLILEFSLLPRLSRGPAIDVPLLHYQFSRKAQVMILTPWLFHLMNRLKLDS